MADDSNEQAEFDVLSKGFGGFSLPLGGSGSPRGSGGLTATEETLAEIVAVRRKWAIPDSVFEHLPSRMEELAHSDSRQAVAAAKVLLDMNTQNEQHQAGGSSHSDVVIFLPDNGRGVDG